jgi:hypothetical protein
VKKEEKITVQKMAERIGLVLPTDEPALSLISKSIAVELTLREELLGTASNNPDLHREYIASKSEDAEKLEEELKALPTEKRLEQLRTVFPREDGKPDGRPLIWDYQLKGFFKEASLALLELGALDAPTNPRFTKWTGKRIIHRGVFVWPRAIVLDLPPGGKIGTCVRPLRVDTPPNERTAIAESETVPVGTTCKVLIGMIGNLEKLVLQSLAYGSLSGLGQWRNSGKGRFSCKYL